MAHALLELETIDAEQIDDIMAGRPPRPPRSGGAGAQAGAAPAPGSGGAQGAPQPA